MRSLRACRGTTRRSRCSVARSHRLATMSLGTMSLAAASVGLTACTGHEHGASPPRGPATSAADATAAALTPVPADSAAAPAVPLHIDSTKDAPCNETQGWDTAAQQGGGAMTTAPLYLVRAGRHDCYDRVVFDLNGGEEVGYSAEYVPIVRADGSGRSVPVEGQAALQVVIRGPILGADTQGHQPGRQPPRVGADLVSTTGWDTLTGVKFAGTFEGQTTVAVGVREQRPFRVWVRSEPSYRHVVIDIAH
jgi:hypothetical protein